MPPPRSSNALITTLADLQVLTARLIAEAKPFGVDIETGYEGEPREKAQLHPEEGLVAGFSLTNSVRWARYVPVHHDSGTNVGPEREVAILLWDLLATGLGIPFHAKFELRFLAAWFMEVIPDYKDVAVRRGYFPLYDDPMLGWYTVGKDPAYNLKDLTRAKFPGHEQAELKSLFKRADPKNEGQWLYPTKNEMDCIRFNVLDQHAQDVIDYACEDAVYALAHSLTVLPRVKDRLLYQADWYVEQFVLPDMEDEGICYDWLAMRDGAAAARDFASKLQVEIRDKLNEMLGERGQEPLAVLNINSHPQLRSVLYDRLGMSTRVMTKGGKKSGPQMSTGKIALKGLAIEHAVVKKVLNYKSLSRLAGTYLEKYEGKFNYAPDGRAHPNHLQVAVPTGRFAVGDPPYQQSPKKYRFELESGEVFSFNFRDMIVSPPGWYILGFDFSQIELRVIAGEAGETSLLEAFARGDDVHRLTAALMLGIPLAEVNDVDRATGKTMNFALMYQMGAEGLADRLGITQAEANAKFDQYFLAYPNIKRWIDKTVAEAGATGYTTSRFGRQHPIWQFLSGERWQRAEGERAAGNYPIQGGAADYMKVSMVRVDKALRAAGWKTPDGKGDVRLVMNIHDALEFYVKDGTDFRDIIRLLQPAIEWHVEGWPPIKAEWHVGRKWGSVRELEVLDEGRLVRFKQAEAEPETGEIDGDVDDEEDGEELVQPRNGYVPAAGAFVSRGSPPAAPPVAPGRVQPGPLDSGSVGWIDVLPHPAAGNGGAGPRAVVIVTPGMPPQEGIERLLKAMASAPGSNTVRLRAGADEYQLPGTCSLTPEHAPQVSLLLGGAQVFWLPDSQLLADLGSRLHSSANG